MKYSVIRTLTVATEGARTKRGGVIRHASGKAIKERRIVRVGDLAVYPDGSAARVVSGCGALRLDRGLPLAILGSELSNGDVIVGSPCTEIQFEQMEGDTVEGLLECGWHRTRQEDLSR